MTDSTKRPVGGASAGRTSGRKPSTGPAGSPRAGRRSSQRRRYEEQTTLQRFRTPIIAAAVIAVVVGVSAFVFTSAAAPTFACTTIDTVKPAASGEIGQIQPDMGNQHVNSGEKVTYPVCPPASGKHVNRSGYGPLQPKVYGPDDNSSPTGWVHNLEHGGLVLLYSCDKGACDDATLQTLRAFSVGFPTSAICQIPAGVVGPVVARFEQMPTKFAALVWNRVLYMDTLDTQLAYDFFLKDGERVSPDGQWITPPEPQCNPPSASPEPSASVEASPSASASAAPSPQASVSASPSVEPSPSPAAS
ncbi:MAG TPA: DUF3105 domain-containing protein [Candidatus Limnocylindrales bacterium]